MYREATFYQSLRWVLIGWMIWNISLTQGISGLHLIGKVNIPNQRVLFFEPDSGHVYMLLGDDIQLRCYQLHITPTGELQLDRNELWKKNYWKVFSYETQINNQMIHLNSYFALVKLFTGNQGEGIYRLVWFHLPSGKVLDEFRFTVEPVYKKIQVIFNYPLLLIHFFGEKGLQAYKKNFLFRISPKQQLIPLKFPLNNTISRVFEYRDGMILTTTYSGMNKIHPGWGFSDNSPAVAVISTLSGKVLSRYSFSFTNFCAGDILCQQDTLYWLMKSNVYSSLFRDEPFVYLLKLQLPSLTVLEKRFAPINFSGHYHNIFIQQGRLYVYVFFEDTLKILNERLEKKKQRILPISSVASGQNVLLKNYKLFPFQSGQNRFVLVIIRKIPIFLDERALYNSDRFGFFSVQDMEYFILDNQFRLLEKNHLRENIQIESQSLFLDYHRLFVIANQQGALIFQVEI